MRGKARGRRLTSTSLSLSPASPPVSRLACLDSSHSRFSSTATHSSRRFINSLPLVHLPHIRAAMRCSRHVGGSLLGPAAVRQRESRRRVMIRRSADFDSSLSAHHRKLVASNRRRAQQAVNSRGLSAMPPGATARFSCPQLARKSEAPRRIALGNVRRVSGYCEIGRGRREVTFPSNTVSQPQPGVAE